MEKHIIVGIHITERVSHASQVQQVLTDFGCSIRTRLGLHETDESKCSSNGLILLEMAADDSSTKEMISKLDSIEGVEIQQMVFNHP